MEVKLANQIYQFLDLYHHCRKEAQELDALYKRRYLTPYYHHDIENLITYLEKEIATLPAIEQVKQNLMLLQEQCPHEIINRDTHRCALCHAEYKEEKKQKQIFYSQFDPLTANHISIESYVRNLVETCKDTEIDLIKHVQEQYYNYKKILIMGGFMRDNPLLFEEEIQDQVYELLSSLKHLYIENHHNLTVIGTRKACFYPYLNDNLKTYQARTNTEVKEILNQLKNESFDYIVDTLEQKDLKNYFPNSIVISYFNESHIDSNKMQQYKIDYALSTASYEAHDFKYYDKDGEIQTIAQNEIFDKINTLTRKKNR